jgi:heat shock protein HslJ
VLLVIVGVSATGCVKPGEPPQPPRQEAEQFIGNWLVTDYHSTRTGAPAAVLPGSGISLTLDGRGSLSGSACNVYGGTWLVDGNRFTVPDLWWHARSCGSPEGIMEQENQYFAALKATDRAEVRAGVLLLYVGDRLLVRAVRA